MRVSALIGSHLASSLGDKDGPMLPFAAHRWTLGNAATSEGSVAFHHNTAQTGEPPLESGRSIPTQAERLRSANGRRSTRGRGFLEMPYLYWWSTSLIWGVNLMGIGTLDERKRQSGGRAQKR